MQPFIQLIVLSNWTVHDFAILSGLTVVFPVGQQFWRYEGFAEKVQVFQSGKYKIQVHIHSYILLNTLLFLFRMIFFFHFQTSMFCFRLKLRTFESVWNIRFHQGNDVTRCAVLYETLLKYL